MRHFYIDTDVGVDEAVALVMALRHPDIQVEEIGVVCRNVAVDQAVQNALFIEELCDAKVPVYRGMERPLFWEFVTVAHAHGKDGLGDIGFPLLGRAPASGHAVSAMLDTIDSFQG